MKDFKDIYKKCNLKESADSKFLDYDELVDFPYAGEDYNGTPVMIIRKGTWDSLSRGSNPEDYDIDEDLASRCVLVEVEGRKVVYVYDESGALAYRTNKVESTNNDSFILLDIRSDDKEVADEAAKYAKRHLGLIPEIVFKDEMYYLKITTDAAADFIVSKIDLDSITERLGY